jgi:hypothetical protein
VFDLIDDAQRTRFARVSTTSAAESTVADQLVKLGELHQAGLLTVDEFKAAKQRLLGS